jgi:uncharacterized protein YndB with AHSA1/START domain
MGRQFRPNGRIFKGIKMEAEFIITRQFKQPLEKVWQAWSLSEQIGQWWGPEGCTLDVHLFEFRPAASFIMR